MAIMAEVSGGRVRGRRGICWMDGLKVATGNGGMTVESVRQCEPWKSPGTYEVNEFHEAIFACPCVLSDLPPVLWWLSPGEGWDAFT